jgi:hypothetical protein
MIEILEFVLSDFLRFAGFMIMICVPLAMICEILGRR